MKRYITPDRIPIRLLKATEELARMAQESRLQEDQFAFSSGCIVLACAAVESFKKMLLKLDRQVLGKTVSDKTLLKDRLPKNLYSFFKKLKKVRNKIMHFDLKENILSDDQIDILLKELPIKFVEKGQELEEDENKRLALKKTFYDGSIEEEITPRKAQEAAKTAREVISTLNESYLRGALFQVTNLELKRATTKGSSYSLSIKSASIK
ncbi:MAG: hypothetical protein KAV99_07110 [Candidatus Latescibacteria bacterium]|nr:hypothetical protein [Candidatus Latescibacterota bacterium]